MLYEEHECVRYQEISDGMSHWSEQSVQHYKELCKDCLALFCWKYFPIPYYFIFSSARGTLEATELGVSLNFFISEIHLYVNGTWRKTTQQSSQDAKKCCIVIQGIKLAYKLPNVWDLIMTSDNDIRYGKGYISFLCFVFKGLLVVQPWVHPSGNGMWHNSMAFFWPNFINMDNAQAMNKAHCNIYMLNPELPNIFLKIRFFL